MYQDPLLGLEGLDAVVDKDRVSAILASQLDAEVLMILTNVDAVFEGWGTPKARPIRQMTRGAGGADDRGGSLDAGGMKPKIEAAVGFRSARWRARHHRPTVGRTRRPARRDRNHHHEDAVNLHEYQARALLKAAGIPMLDGDVASTPTEAESIARRLGGAVVIKAQVHAGGRGKAGGVKLARNPGEALDHAAEILGMSIKGLEVHKVLVVPAADIATESYLGLIMDREIAAAGVHGELRRRYRHRGGRREDAREDPAPTGRSDLRPAAAPGADPGVRPVPGLQSGQGRGADHGAAVRRLYRPTAARWPRSTRW